MCLTDTFTIVGKSIMNDWISSVRRHRHPVTVAFDVGVWVTTFLVSAWLRYDASSDRVPWLEIALAGLLTGLLYVGVSAYLRLHQGRAATGSLDQMMLLGVAVSGTGVFVFALNLVFVWVPRSIPAAATVATLVVAAWARAAWRSLKEREVRPVDAEGAVRVLVVGAGSAGRDLIVSMLRDPKRAWRPVGLLDDDPLKQRLRVRGVPVLGTTADLAGLVEQTGVRTVVLALPGASAALVNRLRLETMAAGATVKVLPASTQLLTDTVGIRDLRDINLTDVLGRNQLDTDVGAIADYLTGRRVLVTGAGGSIGSELCRQIHRYEPSELIMLDRDESALHALQLSIHGRALLDSDEVVLCDIRDKEAVNTVFSARRPDVVFHAAALKHLPMLEQYPAEAVKTNIIGTRNVLDAADLVDVDHFVNISTDKAANPSSVLGYSKRVAERLTSLRAQDARGSFVSVRFGNVLGSRGSVLTSFAKQIADGGPVTVTDPEVTRFFMTIEEACQLVVQAAAIGAPGEALVLDMGDPVKILDVAHQLIEQAGAPVEVQFTGLREGEKMHEELFGDHEPQHVRPIHPLVSHVPVPSVTEQDVEDLPVRGGALPVRDAMAALCASEPRFDPIPASVYST